jgi:hypothetical protein
MNWAKSHWRAIAISTILFFVGIGIGANSSTESETVASERTVTVVETETVEGETVTAAAPEPEEDEAPADEIPGDGTYIVGQDIKPGRYRASGGETCYWARLKDTEGGIDSIIANNISPGQSVVTIKPTDAAFQTSGCGTFTRIG